MNAAEFTPARRRALVEIVEAGDHGARYSNASGPGCAYWQCADWLLAEGLAEWNSPSGADRRLVATAAGRDALEPGLAP